VEIGVHRGGSLPPWCDYFPGADVVGIDLVRPERVDPRAALSSSAPIENIEFNSFMTLIGPSTHPAAGPARLRTVRGGNEGFLLRPHRLGRRAGKDCRSSRP
jgi:hypothetical protein